MSNLPSRVPNVLGNTSLAHFDVVIIGSGPGGGSAVRVLADAGLTVCILEAGNNYFLGLDDPRPGFPIPLFSSDELKLSTRGLVSQQTRVEPRTFRESVAQGKRTYVGEVNNLPKAVGGGQIHADGKTPRFNDFDFRMRSELGDMPDADWADWPLTYDELEPFYAAAEHEVGVSGRAGANPFESPRSADYPLPPGPDMYVGALIGEGARKLGYTPFPYPGVNLSRAYDGRPACNDCGLCSFYGCPTNAKGTPAVTTIRKALLTGRVQLRYNCIVTRIVTNAVGNEVTGLQYLDPAGQPATVSGDRYILAAGGIESARLCLLSDRDGPGVGNSSDRVGRCLMYHFQTLGIGIYRQSLHGERGRSVASGMADFRGVPNDPDHPLGGVIEFGTNSEKISEAKNYVHSLFARGRFLKKLLRASPFGAHIGVMTLQGEDAPQLTNRVDLDPDVKDIHGQPAARITYQPHAFELSASRYYGERMIDIHGAAGAQFAFVPPRYDGNVTPTTRHVMGAMRMGSDPRTSVVDRLQRFHDIGNLWCIDGSVLPTGSGYNPTLTIEALALRAAAAMVDSTRPEAVVARLAVSRRP
ncbi:MAG: GMC family oxidoreductase [Deltaproteobacteria bacterium]|nr:GMC family oxidoreductase [Deltaproteobacteria bacterium]